MSFEIIKPGSRINFIGNRYIAFVFSAILIAVCLGSLVYKGGPRMGIDFAGGLLMQVRFSGELIKADDLRQTMSQAGLGGAGIQQVGSAELNEFQINIRQDANIEINQASQNVTTILKEAFGAERVDMHQVDMVGPKVGQDLRQKALYALFYSILMILIYISGRFEQKWGTSAFLVGALLVVTYLAGMVGVSISYLIVLALLVTMGLCYAFKFEFALGAILALVHDVIVTVGVFSILDKELTLAFVAAILTIVGYSLNDSIIIFDRIRESLRKTRKTSYAETINTSINETLSRTILTSGSTLLVIACLYIFGSPATRDFALALFVGIGIGTFSSIFISAPVLLFWNKKNA